jgi:hypothetical protein
MLATPEKKQFRIVARTDRFTLRATYHIQELVFGNWQDYEKSESNRYILNEIKSEMAKLNGEKTYEETIIE